MVTTDGFVRLPNWLVDDSDLSLYELAVYIVLLRFRDPKTGKCFPGMTTIADRARISRKSVERAIPGLEARGMIKVSRRSSLKENKPNVYTVALATEEPEFIWTKSARGRRVPKHPRTTDSQSVGKGTDAESVGTEGESETTDAESVPTDSQSPPPQTHSRPKKIHRKKIQQQALTPALSSGSEDQFTFSPSEEQPTATRPQLNYLSDLFIHLHHKPADEMQVARWAKLTRTEATEQVRGYLDALGRPDEHLYPKYGTKEYGALSPAGKAFADTGGMPDAVA